MQIRALSAHEPFEDEVDRLAMRTADGVVIMVMASNKCVYADSSMAEITGYTVREIVSNGLEFMDKLSRALLPYRRIVKCAPYLCQYETVIARKNGEALLVEITASEILWQGEEAFKVFVRIAGGI